MKQKVFIPLALCSFLIACKSISEGGSVKGEVDLVGDGSINVDYMDKSVKPQNDFFMYSNGTWVKNNPVPPSESRWGSFNELEKSNVEKLTSILEEASQGSGSNKLIGQYYASFMNMSKRNELGISPIELQLEAIDRINDKSEIPTMIAQQHKLGISSLFRFGVGQDIKNVEEYLVSFSQGGLTLPNRDYYIEEDKKEIREAYSVYITDILILAGKSKEDARRMAVNIDKFETVLAGKMLRPAEMRNPDNRYHKMSPIEGFADFADFKMTDYVGAIGIAEFDSINIGQPAHAENIGEMFNSMSLQQWKDYLYWKTLNHYVGHLDEKFVKRQFEFYGGVLSGKTEMKPYNELAIEEITNMEFGELLGKAFVEQYYSKEAQQTINELVDNLLMVFRERIENLEWMSETTRGEAVGKLKSIGRKLGFPTKWTDFSALKFDREDYIGNLNNASALSFKENLAKLGKPVNKDEWGMPAHMVNAYYHPLLNEIAFPAGIMQPPFFSAEYEDAVNYGRIGMVIGHEFTHGFDDNGSRFDASGNYNNWWTESDRKLFEERTALLGNTFAEFCPVDDHCVNPELTMGENIADLGGLTLAFHAYMLTEEYKSGELKNGFTPAQRFFIAYAQLWKINYTEEELKKRLATDPHSPGMYRVNGPLKNCPEFFEAFDIKEGDPMRNEASKVSKIW